MRLILTLLFLFALLNGGAQTVSEATKTKLPDSNSLKKVLVFIDGVEKKISDIKQLDSILKPENIESINVLKDKSATDKYGEKAKDGVIEIVTKKYKEVKITDLRGEGKNDVDDDPNIIFTKAELEASFRGGFEAWKNFLMKNLDANVPIKNKAPLGTYTIVIQFIVDKQGKISDLRALTNHGYGMEIECIRVMNLSPDWVPAMQNGRNVKAFRKQPITFVVARD